MSDGGRDLSRDQILALLTELGAALAADGLVGSIYVVGGAAMALALDSRRVTRDIDASLRDHPEQLRHAAAVISARHNLSPDWLNSAATVFLSSEPDVDPGEMTVPGLRVSLASPEHLLAMKIRASRGKDYADLEILFDLLGITDPQQAADITNRLFDESSIGWVSPDEALFLAQDVFTRATRAGRSIGSGELVRQHLHSAARAGGSWAAAARRWGAGGVH